MISSRRYIPPDFERFELRKRDRWHGEKSGYQYMIESASVQLTLMTEKLEVAGLVGLSRLWDGVAQAWLFTSEIARGHGLSYTKECRRLLEYHANRLDFFRVHIVVDTSIEENIRWAKLVGFEYECTMKNAAPDGSDMDIMVYWPKGGRYGRRRSISTAA